MQCFKALQNTLEHQPLCGTMQWQSADTSLSLMRQLFSALPEQKGTTCKLAIHSRDRLSYLASVTLSSLCHDVDGQSCGVAHDFPKLAFCPSISKAGMGVIEYEV